MSKSPEDKDQSPKTQPASGDEHAQPAGGAQNGADGGETDDGSKSATANEPPKVVVDEDSAYDDLVADKQTQQESQTVQAARQSESETQRTPQPVRPTNSWPLVRKFEALIFMAMFAAVPLFAVRVIQYTHDQLIVRNVSKELVKDLQRAKTLAVRRQKEVEVSGSASKTAKLFSYVVLIGEQVSEEVVLPERVSVVGSIKFNKSGMPEQASSFIVSSDNRTTTVEIDPTGLISVPY